MNTLPGARPPALTRLCILSFINQGAMFFIYLSGLVAAPFLRDSDPQVLRDAALSLYQGTFEPDELERLYAMLDTFREHGVVLMSVFAIRTIARFIGTLRMWRLHGDGFHVYTTAQLLGVLVPMLIAGKDMVSPLGLVAAALWCFMYFVRMRAIGALGSGLGR